MCTAQSCTEHMLRKRASFRLKYFVNVARGYPLPESHLDHCKPWVARIYQYVGQHSLKPRCAIAPGSRKLGSITACSDRHGDKVTNVSCSQMAKTGCSRSLIPQHSNIGDEKPQAFVVIWNEPHRGALNIRNEGSKRGAWYHHTKPVAPFCHDLGRFCAQ